MSLFVEAKRHFEIHLRPAEVMAGLQDLQAFSTEAASACDLIYQAASALAEADRHHLVHRDIKPSNIRVTPEEQAKLLDFGLVRHYRNRLTEPGSVLGTIDYVAPEQCTDASAVDIRADIYSLGGTLFWCLTQRVPFPSHGSAVQDLVARLSQPPPTVRDVRPETPPELELVVRRMMARSPEDRYQTPQAVMRALLPLLSTGSARNLARLPGAATVPLAADVGEIEGGSPTQR